jgi:hypothetical protein
MLGSLKDRPAALVIAHPGHELRVYHWVSLARPLVFVLTDGSGRSGKSRLHRTQKILNSLGARPGSIYGRLTDAEIYAAILNSETDLFVGLAEELAESLHEGGVEYVVGDAIEGYNPGHDVCRLVTNAAVEKVRQFGNSVENFDVLLASAPGSSLPEATKATVALAVDEQTLAQKLQAAHEYSEVEVDVNRILAHEGAAFLRNEYLRPVTEALPESLYHELPYYEVHGEEQVAAGYYRQVIRYREHVLPIAGALRRFSERSNGSC